MDLWLIFALFFAFGTLILYNKSERHFIFFMIRTKHFLNLIDKVARISPRFWKFLADLAIVLSFSGFGAAYLSRYRKFSRNLDLILTSIGLVCIFLWIPDIVFSIILLPFLILGIRSLSRIKNPNSDFLVATTLISGIWLRMLHWIMAVLEGMFGLSMLVFTPLVENALAISSGESTTPGISPVILIPFKVAGEWCFPIPGMGICIPVIYGMIALVLLLVVHEFAHGVLARVHKLKLRSTGLVTLGIVPIGAFVEPDEEKFQKSESLTKTRVLAMGSFSNLSLGILSFLLFLYITLPSAMIVAESSVPYIDVNTKIEFIGDMPASINSFDTHLFPNKLWGIDEKSIRDDKIDVTTEKGRFVLGVEDVKNIKMRAQPRFRYNYYLYGINIFEILAGILFWSFFFNINIGLINILPIPPLDGGKMLPELISILRVDKATIRKIVYVIILVGLLIILVNALPLIDMLFSRIEKIADITFISQMSNISLIS